MLHVDILRLFLLLNRLEEYHTSVQNQMDISLNMLRSMVRFSIQIAHKDNGDYGMYSINSFKMIGNDFPAVLMNFNRLYLKLKRFICNQLPVLADHWSSAMGMFDPRGVSSHFSRFCVSSSALIGANEREH